jgi:DNA-directed RNA polymerase specialized sigma24 family protein
MTLSSSTNSRCSNRRSTSAPDELFDALERLPYRQRAAIVLRFYQGLPDADVAEALGCRVGTGRRPSTGPASCGR